MFDLLCSLISIFHSVLWIGRPTVNSEEIITLQEGTNDFFLRINFTEGNPRSTMNITGPFQPGNPRVSISSEGVRINGVSVNDSGTHIATWRNIEGVATFTLDLNVEVTGKFCMVLLGIMLLKRLH